MSLNLLLFYQFEYINSSGIIRQFLLSGRNGGYVLTDAYKNLKGESHPLIYYRTTHEDTKIEKSRKMLDKKGEVNEFFYYDTIVNRIVFTEEKVKGFSLDGIGQNIEFEDHQFTMVHNYLIHFWQPILKADTFALYITLKSYCMNKDYCWPSISTLEKETGMSKNTVKKRLATLEDYGFVFRFNCATAQETENRKKNMEESPIYKVRKRVPFLPKEIYEQQLPDELKDKHDIFMKNYMSVYSADNLANRINYDEIYSEFLGNGEVIKKKKSSPKKSVDLKQIYNIKESMTQQDEEITQHILRQIQKMISKPSFETWFQYCLFKIREGIVTIYAQNDFSASWIKERYLHKVTDILNEINIKPLDIKITCIEE